MTVLLVGVAIGVLAGGARANHTPGATYKGTHAAGQEIWLTVSPDGAVVTKFIAIGVPGNICTFLWSSRSGAWPITDDPHTFSISEGEFSALGTFTGPETAEGTLRLGGDGTSCESNTLAWSARVTDLQAPPPPAGGPPAVRCRVPRVIGLRFLRARAEIRRSHCSVGPIRYVRSTRARWRVVSQMPRPGVVGTRGTPVRLTVSRGRKAK